MRTKRFRTRQRYDTSSDSTLSDSDKDSRYGMRKKKAKIMRNSVKAYTTEMGTQRRTHVRERIPVVKRFPNLIDVMASQQCKLCSLIIREHFGEVVEKVSNALHWGPQTLGLIVSSSKLPASKIITDSRMLMEDRETKFKKWHII
ncbi:hypothetical protein J6590_001178 [Homalodisca vitripennis]|nr:hypothetical protein J6590_001178 [Homalodisca vitripennis]